MYTECLSCPKLGVSCDGPNFVTMSAHDLLEWCKARKLHLDLTNAELSELSRTPKGTIDRLFAGEHNDYKYETIRPLVRALVGGDPGGNPCPAPEISLEARVSALEQENQKLTLQVAQTEQDYEDEIDEIKEEHKEEARFLRGQIKGKNVAIGILSFALTVALSLIIGFLIYDYLNRDVGFFWLEP